jgi:hypothetical protein
MALCRPWNQTSHKSDPVRVVDAQNRFLQVVYSGDKYMNIEKELGYLEDAIYAFGMKEFWSDSPFLKTEEEVKQKVAEKAGDAKIAFLRIMQSPKNNGTEAYREWAIRCALGLKQAKHNVR